MESTDLKSSNATTVKLSRASLVTAIDTWHRSVVFHASIVDTPSARAISESLPKTPGHMLVPTEPTFTKLDLDEDGDPRYSNADRKTREQRASATYPSKDSSPTRRPWRTTRPERTKWWP